MTGGDLGDYAVEAAVRGWEVFPLHGKVPTFGSPHPLGSRERATCKRECGLDGHGLWDATADLDRVDAWWGGRYAGANIGARVPDHVMVVDVDPRHGGHLSWQTLADPGRPWQTLADPGRPWQTLIDTHGPPAVTLTAESGRGDGGRHCYFRAPPGGRSPHVVAAPVSTSRPAPATW